MQAPNDLLPLLKKIQMHHHHILKACHMCNRKPWGNDAEKNSLYCTTRFLSRDKAIECFVNDFNNQTDENGNRVPVILLGHAWHNDQGHLSEQWQLKINKLESVIFTIGNLATLGRQAGIISDSEVTNPGFDKQLQNFGVSTFDGLWKHNGANDSMYQSTMALIYTYSKCLYPNTHDGRYPDDQTIDGLTLREIWGKVAEHNKQLSPPTYGIKQLCHYCETADDHDATACPALKDSKVKCDICAEAIGKFNGKYRGAKALGYHAGRCIAQYSMQTRSFPKSFMDCKPTDEELRRLSHASAVADYNTLGKILYTRYLGSEWVGRDELLDQATRIKFEEAYYPDLDEDGNKLPNPETKVTLSLDEISDDDGPLVTSPDVSLAVRIKLGHELEETRKEAADIKAKYDALLLKHSGE
jgi:hypothetical protein